MLVISRPASSRFSSACARVSVGASFSASVVTQSVVLSAAPPSSSSLAAAGRLLAPGEPREPIVVCAVATHGGTACRARLRESASPPTGAHRLRQPPFTDKCLRTAAGTTTTCPMRAMDLKHHDALYNSGGRPNGGPSVIKSEPRSISPCYSTPGNRDLHSPPSNGSAGSGSTAVAAISANPIFNGMAAKRHHRIPDDWLSPRSPVALNLPSGSSSTASNLSTSPGPSMHGGVYPSTSNGYPSPGGYDPYISGSKMSESLYQLLIFVLLSFR